MTPACTVVIPTYNRAATLRRCLDALAAQTAPPGSFEAVVVDDGSTDETRAMLEGYGAAFPLRAIHQENQRVARARNRGIAEARGAFCLFIDDDIVAAPGLVAHHLAAHAARRCVAIGRLHTQPTSDDALAHRVATWLNGHYDELDAGREPTFVDTFSGNLSAPTDVLLAIGGFAPDLPRYEDVEIGIRLRETGLPFHYLPLAEASQEFDKGFADVLADAYRLGLGAAATARRHPFAVAGTDLAGLALLSQRRRLGVRLLLALPPLPQPLLEAGQRAARLAGRDEPYEHVLERATYWRGIRDGLADRRAWLTLTRRPRGL